MIKPCVKSPQDEHIFRVPAYYCHWTFRATRGVFRPLDPAVALLRDPSNHILVAVRMLVPSDPNKIPTNDHLFNS